MQRPRDCCAIQEESRDETLSQIGVMLLDTSCAHARALARARMRARARARAAVRACACACACAGACAGTCLCVLGCLRVRVRLEHRLWRRASSPRAADPPGSTTKLGSCCLDILLHIQ
eukprot:6412039-Alexandrium_andersonii.AAC.2